MKVIVKSSVISGTIKANASKSYAQRAYAMAALADSQSRIFNTSWSDDAIAALGIVQKLDGKVEIDDHVVQISPGILPRENIWDVGEAGLSLRMFSPVAALYEEEITIQGHGSLLSRPTDFIADTLRLMGAKVSGGKLPMRILGPLVSGKYHIDGNFSSQLLTGLLIALPTLKGNSRLVVANLKSTPYIDMTIHMLRQFGIEVGHLDHRTFDIRGDQIYKGTDIHIEADWSGLAFVLVAATISGKADTTGSSSGRAELTLTGVEENSCQADRAIVEVLRSTGCDIVFENGNVGLKSQELVAFAFDATHCPDLFPPLAILATQCEGESRITGVHRLKHKESDRANTLRNELGKLGAKIDVDGDVMIIKGRQVLHGGEVDACGDHRIAMALVCAGLIATSDVAITGAACISKSYADFYTDIRALNGIIDGDKSLFININRDTYQK